MVEPLEVVRREYHVYLQAVCGLSSDEVLKATKLEVSDENQQDMKWWYTRPNSNAGRESLFQPFFFNFARVGVFVPGNWLQTLLR